MCKTSHAFKAMRVFVTKGHGAVADWHVQDGDLDLKLMHSVNVLALI